MKTENSVLTGAVNATELLACCAISSALNIAHLIEITKIPESHRAIVIERIIATFENSLRAECSRNVH